MGVRVVDRTNDAEAVPEAVRDQERVMAAEAVGDRDCEPDPERLGPVAVHVALIEAVREELRLGATESVPLAVKVMEWMESDADPVRVLVGVADVGVAVAVMVRGLAVSVLVPVRMGVGVRVTDGVEVCVGDGLGLEDTVPLCTADEEVVHVRVPVALQLRGGENVGDSVGDVLVQTDGV